MLFARCCSATYTHTSRSITTHARMMQRGGLLPAHHTHTQQHTSVQASMQARAHAQRALVPPPQQQHTMFHAAASGSLHTRAHPQHHSSTQQHSTPLFPPPLPRPSAASPCATHAVRLVHTAAARGAGAIDTSTQGTGVAAPAPKGVPSPALALVQQAGIQIPQFCCGCGVRLQQTQPEATGYFIVPNRLLEMAEEKLQGRSGGTLQGADDMLMGGEEDALQAEYEEAAAGLSQRRREGSVRASSVGGDEDEEDFPDEEEPMPDVLCQRCYSLKHTGAVKIQAAEETLPDFDLGKKVGRKIFLQKDRRAVVLMVVDASDFDGSLPKEAIMSLLPPGYTPPPVSSSSRDNNNNSSSSSRRSIKEAEEEAGPLKFRLMVALNKVDLLPKEATQARLGAWVRSRMAAAGLPRPEKVFCVSAPKAVNVKPVAEDIRAALGFRGDLWVVGAQNAGKSSLIAAMKRLAGTGGQREPTVASMPGTTLGLINVPGLPLGAKHRAFDTPGVPHVHQLTTHLSREDVKQVLPHKPLVPRTYRVPAGSTLLMGGLARLDIVECPSATLYLTAWMSSHVTLHMGKSEGAAERQARHVGDRLTPPASLEAWEQLPPMRGRDMVVEGDAWDRSSMDIHIAGLGWIAVGVTGTARFVVHTHPDVAVTTRPALLPDFAKQFQRPGFSNLLPKGSKVQQKKGRA